MRTTEGDVAFGRTGRDTLRVASDFKRVDSYDVELFVKFIDGCGVYVHSNLVDDTLV